MTETALSPLDVRLVAALQVNGRASWEQLGEVLRVSERTVARRLNPLLGSGAVKVRAVRNPFAMPEVTPLVLRVRCRPGHVLALAEALARREDCLEASVLDGGDEVVAIMFMAGAERRRAFLLKYLPASKSVRSWSVYTVLRVFLESLWWHADVLTDEEVTALRPHGLVPAAFEQVSDPVELAVIEALSRDGRLGYPDLARLVGTSESTVRRRVARIARRGALRIATEVDIALLGYQVEANLWLSVPPAAIDRVGLLLSRHPATRLVMATSGPCTLFVSVYCRDLAELYRLLTEFVGEQAEVTHLETTPIMHVLKRSGSGTH
ncbi:Lrp/AsnC family transcriptional regulator [Kutzneria viridogrisea]|uniref:Transcription regulator, AsnC family n=2 Tax=Kutzneria TaxID=43356 RepID=W5W008_9PSEU|nr:AsnC family transcriptional regulator [Kutzneria albida]AHH93881.1 transcription regulator, AsnC family [Kutzneria albida DSM 43870]MBA8931114.1 DNA-binding Lrp family transcriptional regulator [Kutzneria viridogrisea]